MATPVSELQGLTLLQLLSRGQLILVKKRLDNDGATVVLENRCGPQGRPDPEALKVLLYFRNEQGVARASADLAQLCADEVRNALVDEVHARLGTVVARLQALSTVELVERARFAYRQGLLAQ